MPGESHEQRSLRGYSPWGRKASDMTERLTVSRGPQYRTMTTHLYLPSVLEGNLSPVPPMVARPCQFSGSGPSLLSALVLVVVPALTPCSLTPCLWSSPPHSPSCFGALHLLFPPVGGTPPPLWLSHQFPVLQSPSSSVGLSICLHATRI